MSERITERRRAVDLDRPVDRLTLVRDLMALANSGGGTISIGVGGDGTLLGLPTNLAEKLDTASVRALTDHYTAPDELGVVVDRSRVDSGFLVELHVPAAPEPPVMPNQPGLASDGAAEDGGGTSGALEHEVFPAHSVWIRRSGRSRTATREDHRRWRADAVAATRSTILEQLTMVVEAPAGSRIQVLTNTDLLDEPSFLLRRSADLFARRSDRLLSADDLLYLWLHRSRLDLTVGDAPALLVQSALRRRATLFLWLAELELTQDDVRRQLRRALTMNDRDKSDAARSILQVASLHLGSGDYARLRTALAESRYAHMREAAGEWPEAADARATVVALNNARYQRLTGTELETEADTIIRDQPSRAVRALPGIGYALLTRRMERRGHAGRPPATRRR
jgi:hypothetical protein